MPLLTAPEVFRFFSNQKWQWEQQHEYHIQPAEITKYLSVYRPFHMAQTNNCTLFAFMKLQ